MAPEQDYLIDNISNTLQVAKGDASIAKRMFVFLGLPGAILAAILTAYAGTLLAGAQVASAPSCGCVGPIGDTFFTCSRCARSRLRGSAHCWARRWASSA